MRRGERRPIHFILSVVVIVVGVFVVVAAAAVVFGALLLSTPAQRCACAIRTVAERSSRARARSSRACVLACVRACVPSRAVFLCTGRIASARSASVCQHWSRTTDVPAANSPVPHIRTTTKYACVRPAPHTQPLIHNIHTRRRNIPNGWWTTT